MLPFICRIILFQTKKLPLAGDSLMAAGLRKIMYVNWNKDNWQLVYFGFTYLHIVWLTVKKPWINTSFYSVKCLSGEKKRNCLASGSSLNTLSISLIQIIIRSEQSNGLSQEHVIQDRNFTPMNLLCYSICMWTSLRVFPKKSREFKRVEKPGIIFLEV